MGANIGRHVKVIDKGWDRLRRQIKRVRDLQVTIGYQGPKGGQTYEGNAASVAAVAMFHEFGTRNMPARPTLRPTIDANRRRLSRMMRDQINKALAGQQSYAQALGRVGLLGERLVRQAVRDLTIPPLADSTKQRKADRIYKAPDRKRKAKPKSPRTVKGSSGNKARKTTRKGPRVSAAQRRVNRKALFLAGAGNPLIDTGQMINSITYQVRRGGVAFGAGE